MHLTDHTVISNLSSVQHPGRALILWPLCWTKEWSMNLKLSICGVVILGLVPMGTAHRIVLVQRSVQWISQTTSGSFVSGYPKQMSDFPMDDPLSIRVGFAAKASYWLPSSPNLTSSVQQTAHAIYTLKWIPEGGKDLPGTAEYSLLVDAYHAYGSASSGSSFPPGLACTTDL